MSRYFSLAKSCMVHGVKYGHAVSSRRPDEGVCLTSPSGCQGLSGQPFRAGRGVVVARSQARRTFSRVVRTILLSAPRYMAMPDGRFSRPFSVK